MLEIYLIQPALVYVDQSLVQVDSLFVHEICSLQQFVHNCEKRKIGVEPLSKISPRRHCLTDFADWQLLL